tara:strand:+ start:177 stop:659 length:483 start_codon:yes stop_codon:yes gene_type:complete
MQNKKFYEEDIVISYTKNNIFTIVNSDKYDTFLNFSTGVVNVPFGIEKYYDSYILKIQLIDKDLIDFINTIENKVKNINKEYFISQIQESKDPYPNLLIIKIDNKKINKLEIQSSNNNLVNFFDIKKNTKIKLNIYVDNIWFNNKKLICKFKTNKICIMD